MRARAPRLKMPDPIARGDRREPPARPLPAALSIPRNPRMEILPGGARGMDALVNSGDSVMSGTIVGRPEKM